MNRELPVSARGWYDRLAVVLLFALFAVGPALVVLAGGLGPFGSATPYGWVLDQFGGRNSIGVVGSLMMFLPLAFLAFLFALGARPASQQTRSPAASAHVPAPPAAMRFRTRGSLGRGA